MYDYEKGGYAFGQLMKGYIPETGDPNKVNSYQEIRYCNKDFWNGFRGEMIRQGVIK